MRVLVGLALSWTVLGLGCSHEPGQAYECRCSFLSDFDDKSSIFVDACGPRSGDEARAREVAQSCAQSGAPAPINACACEVIRDAAPCDEGACHVR